MLQEAKRLEDTDWISRCINWTNISFDEIKKIFTLYKQVRHFSLSNRNNIDNFNLRCSSHPRMFSNAMIHDAVTQLIHMTCQRPGIFESRSFFDDTYDFCEKK